MASSLLVGYGGSSSSESDEGKVKDLESHNRDDVDNKNDNESTDLKSSHKVTKKPETSPLRSGSDDQGEIRKTSTQSRNYSPPSHERRSHHRDNGSSRYRQSGREHRSPDRHARHSRSDRDRSRTPDRQRYSRSYYRQSDRHRDYHRRDRSRRSHSTSPKRYSKHSAMSNYHGRDNSRRMSSGGEHTSHRSSDHRDESQSSSNKAATESNALPATNPSSSSSGTLNAPKPGQSSLNVNSADAETSQEALLKSVLHGSQMINAAKAAIQNQKRKLLWSGKKKEERSSGNWKGVAFDDDSATNRMSKFKRLMGITNQGANKGNDDMASPEESKEPDKIENVEDIKPTDAHPEKSTKMLDDLQQQYDAARVFTHTQRGYGLGFSS
ncbi:Arginine/serine-rich coiled-coil protein 2 [Trichoplax sp. H2]|nr:Arginine/serine-rich coiled-coil protein 2 [Trichoplax sp. H2]|eukprot:RDD46537.1 Arginine/serine-rich coiled-coil protein 2 [Trichoplax sp. H2]